MATERRRILLHIGTRKTGSTAIQESLARERATLLTQGYCYPSSPGDSTHESLAVWARVDRLGVPPELGTVADALPSTLCSELESLPDSVHTVILSSENCGPLCKTSLHKIHDLLSPFANGFLILAYLRPQLEMGISGFSQRLRAGDTPHAILPSPSDHFNEYDLNGILSRWADVFGEASVRPHLYDKSCRHRHGILGHFLESCGIPAESLPPAAPWVNRSLNIPAQDFLMTLNRLRRDGRKPPHHVLHLLDSRFTGVGHQPDHASAAAFAAAFTAGNEALRSRWFPELPELFSLNLDAYPEQQETLGDYREAITVACDIIQQLAVADTIPNAASETVAELGHLSREAAVWAIRLFLGREPLNNAEIQFHRRHDSLDSLRIGFSNTLEFTRFYDQCARRHRT